MWHKLAAAVVVTVTVLAMLADVSVLVSMDVAAERERRSHASIGLLDYCERMFFVRHGRTMKRNAHQVEICAALERVAAGETKRLVINVPPRSGKTELSSIGFTSWAMGRWPDSEFILASYSKRLAAASTFRVRDAMAREEYGAIFGPSRVLDESQAKDEFRTASEGCVYATGAGGTITGYGAGKMRAGFGGAIIVDDPHKAEEAHSKTVREGVLDWFANTMESRRNSPETPIIVIMQRLHVADLAGWLLDGGNGEAWESVVIPALDDAGCSFWPEQYPVEDLRRLEAADSYRFASQYQQRPKILGGNIIKGEWFRRYTEVPPLQYRAIFADTAQKTKERNDYSVFEAWGLGRDGRIYLLDMIRGKWEAPELERRAVAFWSKHAAMNGVSGVLRQLYIEDKASGTGLIQTIREKAHAPVRGIERDKDKLSRVMDVCGQIESGYVCIPLASPWVSDFVAECEGFAGDMSHLHDDQVDPLVDAIKTMIAARPRMTVSDY